MVTPAPSAAGSYAQNVVEEQTVPTVTQVSVPEPSVEASGYRRR